MLLEGIEKRVNNWNPNSKIGDLFVDMIDRFIFFCFVFLFFVVFVVIIINKKK